MPNNITGIIFDLDDTLFDCTGQLTGAARLRAAKVFNKTRPDLTIADLVLAQEALSQSKGSGGALESIGHQYNLPDEDIACAKAAYNINEVGHITPFPDTHATLAHLKDHGYKLVLVTSGHPERQRQKVNKLSLTHYFNEQAGTLILHNTHTTSDKTPFIKQAQQFLNLPANQIAAVGDKLDAEISAANQVGMLTIRLRHGRQKNRAPQTPFERPDFEIDTLSELLPILAHSPA